MLYFSLHVCQYETLKEQGKYDYHSKVTGDDSSYVENNFNLYSKLDTVIYIFPCAYHDDKIL